MASKALTSSDVSAWLIATVAILYGVASVLQLVKGNYGMALMIFGWAVSCIGAVIVERG